MDLIGGASFNRTLTKISSQQMEFFYIIRVCKNEVENVIGVSLKT